MQCVIGCCIGKKSVLYSFPDALSCDILCLKDFLKVKVKCLPKLAAHVLQGLVYCSEV